MACVNPEMPNLWYRRIGGEVSTGVHARSAGRPIRSPQFPFLLPDLTDPATLGCLLSLVRVAWNTPGAYVHHDSGAKLEPGHPWEVWCGDGSNIVGVFDTEAEALVAALESAP
jgi:hypothetical protein